MEHLGRGFWGLFDVLRRKMSPRTSAPGEGKHYKGKQDSPHYRARLKARRKAERQHRRRVQMQAKGRKHKFTR